MNTERAILKGHLADFKMKKMELETSISANIRSVQNFLAGASVRPLAEIDVEAALVNLKEAVAQKHELADILEKIRRTEQELE
jgi:hypothetical protein